MATQQMEQNGRFLDGRPCEGDSWAFKIEHEARKVREEQKAQTEKKEKRQQKDITPGERMGIMGVPLFPSWVPDNVAPPQLHGQMGLTNALLECFICFVDNEDEIVMDEENEARSETWKVSEGLKEKQQTHMEIKADLASVINQLKVDLRVAKQKLRKSKNDNDRGGRHLSVVMLEAELNDNDETITEAADDASDATSVHTK
jgi:septal ring factor EnvC (AmiA/AmiB activator)